MDISELPSPETLRSVRQRKGKTFDMIPSASPGEHAEFFSVDTQLLLENKKQNHATLLSRGARMAFFVTQDSKKYFTHAQRLAMDQGVYRMDTHKMLDGIAPRYEERVARSEAFLTHLSHEYDRALAHLSDGKNRLIKNVHAVATVEIPTPEMPRIPEMPHVQLPPLPRLSLPQLPQSLFPPLHRSPQFHVAGITAVGIISFALIYQSLTIGGGDELARDTAKKLAMQAERTQRSAGVVLGAADQVVIELGQELQEDGAKVNAVVHEQKDQQKEKISDVKEKIEENLKKIDEKKARRDNAIAIAAKEKAEKAAEEAREEKAVQAEKEEKKKIEIALNDSQEIEQKQETESKTEQEVDVILNQEQEQKESPSAAVVGTRGAMDGIQQNAAVAVQDERDVSEDESNRRTEEIVAQREKPDQTIQLSQKQESKNSKKIDSVQAPVEEGVGAVLEVEGMSDFEKEAYEMVAGHPIEKMLPYILKKDQTVAAYMIAIAKKESNWGKRVPVLNGQDCYNYWGYRGQRKLMGSGGHTCFNSRQDAVDTVAKRIKTLVYEYERETPSRMVVWKCGRSCEGHGSSAQKWINDVALYYNRLKKSG